MHKDPPKLQPARQKRGFMFASRAAFAWGWLLGRGRVLSYGELRVHTGLPQWAYGRGGTCVGNSFLTGPEPHKILLAHELVHVHQWRKYGWVFPLLYWAAGTDPLRNRFEVAAGLESGGYTSKPSKRIR